jgi:hypothetical protein
VEEVAGKYGSSGQFVGGSEPVRAQAKLGICGQRPCCPQIPSPTGNVMIEQKGAKRFGLAEHPASISGKMATGSTGSGKSKFLEYLIRQDIVSWRDSECGLLLLDPHGAPGHTRTTTASSSQKTACLFP